MKRKTIDFKVMSMRADVTKEGNPKPFDEDNFAEMFVRLTLPRLYELLDKFGIDLQDIAKGKMTIEDISKKVKFVNVHDYSSKIRLLIKDNPKITLEEIAITIGKSKKTVQRAIGASNKIKRVGSAKSGHWIIKD